MKKVFFLFGLHNHQPVGNFEHVFEESYDKCYHPLLETLKSFPSFKMSLHHSGPLIEWIEKNRPAYFKTLKVMVKTGQVEILSGGFYEPILSSLPERDAVGQIKMMNDWIKKKFNTTPRGAWLAERIWDSSLPSVLAAAEIKYTLLDDTHFQYAGLSEKDMYGYWVTERHGNSVAVFPIDKFLRYSIPFKQPEETLEYWHRTADKYGAIGVTYGDDGEKFGVWPETNEWVFGEKWLKRFLQMVSDNSELVETMTYSEYIDRFPPNGRVYLPPASYEEMMEWSLPTEVAKEFRGIVDRLESENRKDEFSRFLRGGQWDNFMVKYEEANQLHKKMLYISKRAEMAAAKVKSAGKNDAIRRELYQGQCNCPYWHGLFGGLYLSNLRHAVYTHLIESGKLADAVLHKGKNWVEINRGDFFKNLGEEIAVETEDLFVLIDPAYGGTIAEIDYKQASFNISNVLTRRPETYHHKILNAGQNSHGEGEILSIHDRVNMKEEGLETKLLFDNLLRRSFMDRMLDVSPTPEMLQKGEALNKSDFAGGRYKVVSAEKKDSAAVIVLSRDGTLITDEGELPLKLRKTYHVDAKNQKLSCEYKIKNGGKIAARFILAVEWNFTLLAADADDRYITVGDERYKMNSIGSDDSLKKWSFTDEYFRFSVEQSSSRPVKLLRYPIETVSQSEDGFESNYQGTCFTALIDVDIAPGKTYSHKFSLNPLHG